MLPWDFQAKTFDYRETIWGVYQDDNKIFPKSKNAVQHPGHYLKKVTVKKQTRDFTSSTHRIPSNRARRFGAWTVCYCLALALY